jgi:succinate-semialdehyde dehydrogenase/glutarate-semialdehyde dehydrogenase
MSAGGAERAVIDAVPKELFIGRWRPAASGARFPVRDPSTGQVLCEVAKASPADARSALDLAVACQQGWAAVPSRERAEILRRCYERLTADAESLALLITLEMGKPLPEARGEVAYAAEFLRWFSEEAVRIGGRYATSPEGALRMLTTRQPVGPCLLITPWNFPLAMGTRKLAPALAAGCTAILKPAAQTPLASLALVQILRDCGLPDGVVGVLPTTDARGVITPLIEDGRARKLSFTGSTPVGRSLSEQCGRRLMRVSMELGGNAPFIVFPDADLQQAVAGAVIAKMRNIGESCIAANRFYVHADVAEAFTTGLAEELARLRVGRGTEPGVQVGPLIDDAAVQAVDALVRDAVDRGARAVVGGEPVPGAGHFYRPTVLTGVNDDARILDEEIFGPVAPVVTFRDEDEVVARANATPYGLVSYVFTDDLDRALRLGDRLDSGMIGVNVGVVSNPAAPFGGIKDSGLGREGGAEGIDEYLDVKYLAIANRSAG